MTLVSGFLLLGLILATALPGVRLQVTNLFFDSPTDGNLGVTALAALTAASFVFLGLGFFTLEVVFRLLHAYYTRI